MHILLVEDEEDLGKSITLGLEVVGFTVTHVTTGEQPSMPWPMVTTS